MKIDCQLSRERYISPETYVIRMIVQDRILYESNTETMIPGGTIPGFEENN